MSRPSRRLVLAVAAALSATACLSPTLPLPPPSRPSVEGPDEKGQVILDGNVLAGATVYAANTRTGELRGQLYTDDTGHYRIQLGAAIGDEIEIWYSIGTDQSPSTVIKVGDPAK